MKMMYTTQALGDIRSNITVYQFQNGLDIEVEMQEILLAVCSM